jgi:S-adenosylmethionine-diacylgycerolhomoserine-N-methlytransferase
MHKQKLDTFYTRQAPIYDLTRRTILFDHDKAVEALELKSTDTVLDVACGTGKNIPRLLKKIKADQIRATDYSHALLGKARSKFPGIHFVHADVTKDQ